MNKPFGDDEKRYMLAEMIRASRIDVGALVEFIKSYNIQPNWMDMHYPHDRSPNEWKHVAESMGIAVPPPPQQYQQQICQPPQHLLQHQLQLQQHQNQLQQHQNQLQQHVPQHTQLLTHLPPMKRKLSSETIESIPKRLAVTTAEAPASRTRTVNIQPRPSPGGFATAASPTIDAVASPPPNPSRRRGRPPKAEREVKSRTSGLLGAQPPLLALAPKQDRLPTSTTPPLTEYSPLPSVASVGISSRASSEPKASAKMRPITPRQSKGTSHEPEDEQSDGSLHKDTGRRQLTEDNPAPLQLEMKATKSSAVQELPANHNLEAPQNQTPVSRVSVTTLLKTGIQAS